MIPANLSQSNNRNKSQTANDLGKNQFLISAPIILQHRKCIDSEPIVREELNKILAHILPPQSTDMNHLIKHLVSNRNLPTQLIENIDNWG